MTSSASGPDLDSDAIIRSAAIKWWQQLRQDNPELIISRQDAWFQLPVPINGKTKFRAMAPQSGIWKPKECTACLSVITTTSGIYEDKLSETTGLISYKYRDQGGYDHPENRSLRAAAESKVPVLYFQGIAAGLYQVHLVLIAGEADDRGGVWLEMVDKLEFMDGVSQQLKTDEASVVERRIYTREVVARTRQTQFRRQVMEAYRHSCAVCRFTQKPLLEAAYIIPFADGGASEVTNGLSLCSIHSKAYQRHIMGIDPDYKVHLNQAMLLEKDGPMLKHGFQEFDNSAIIVPRNKNKRPDRDGLERRYEEFKKAS